MTTYWILRFNVEYDMPSSLAMSVPLNRISSRYAIWSLVTAILGLPPVVLLDTSGGLKGSASKFWEFKLICRRYS